MLQQLVTEIKNSTTIDWLALIFGIAQVVLAWQNKKINFIAGIISVSLYIYIFYTAGLFAESALNIYYLIISIIGFIFWSQSTHSKKITNCTQQDWLVTTSIFILATCVQFYLLKKFTTSTVPFADAVVSSIAWAGTWQLTKHKLQNWLVLSLSNILAIPLFIYKNLYLVVALYIVYFIIAIFGYLKWKKELQLYSAY